MEGHVAKNNESTFPSLGDLDDFLTKHNSNFVWLLVGEFEFCLFFLFFFLLHISGFCSQKKLQVLLLQTYSNSSAVSGSFGRCAIASFWSKHFHRVA